MFLLDRRGRPAPGMISTITVFQGDP